MVEEPQCYGCRERLIGEGTHTAIIGLGTFHQACAPPLWAADEIRDLRTALAAAIASRALRERRLTQLVADMITGWRGYFAGSGGKPEAIWPTFKALADEYDRQQQPQGKPQ